MTSPRGHDRQEFSTRVKAQAFRRCCDEKGIPHCEGCGKQLRAGHTIFEHVQPDGLGGEPTLENCKVHCRTCANDKTFGEDNPRMAKADAQLKAAFGITNRRKIVSRGFAKVAPQRSASRPLERGS